MFYVSNSFVEKRCLYLDVDHDRFIWYILARLAAWSWYRRMVTIATSADLPCLEPSDTARTAAIGRVPCQLCIWQRVGCFPNPA
jgi:hypothetical protein